MNQLIKYFFQCIRNTMPGIIPLIFFVVSHPALAQLPYCSDIFQNGVQTDGEFQNFIRFGYNARITNPSSQQLRAPVVIPNPWSPMKSCGSQHCTAGGAPVPKLFLDPFPGTDWTTKYLVPKGKKMVIGDYFVDFDKVELEAYSIGEFYQRENGYVIDKLFLGYKSTLRLPKGSYYVRDFRMEVESRIEVIGEGTVNLFVQNHLDIQFKAQVNSNTKDPSRLAIYTESSSQYHVLSEIYGFIVTENELILSHGAKIYGGVAAQQIYLESESEIGFDAASASKIYITDLCRSKNASPTFPSRTVTIEYNPIDIKNNMVPIYTALDSRLESNIPITNATVKTASKEFHPELVNNFAAYFELELAIGDNYFTITLEDIYGNTYSSEFYIPYYLPPEFRNVLPLDGAVFNTDEIIVTGEIKTSWSLEFSRLQLDGVTQLIDASDGVAKFAVRKKLREGLQTLTLRFLSPSPEIIEKKIVVTYKPPSAN